jgi:hypothetical protein
LGNMFVLLRFSKMNECRPEGAVCALSWQYTENTAAVRKWIWQKLKLCYWLVAGEGFSYDGTPMSNPVLYVILGSQCSQ